MTLPVGFPGDVNKSNLIAGSDFNVETIYISIENEKTHLFCIDLPGSYLEWDVDYFDFVDCCGYVVHSVCRSANHEFVPCWFTEYSHYGIDSFVATYPTE